jgi:hypothetical protein
MKKEAFIRRANDFNLLFTDRLYDDFLATACDFNNQIEEAEKYFYKPFPYAGNKEIRIWKESKRVSVSQTLTNYHQLHKSMKIEFVQQEIEILHNALIQYLDIAVKARDQIVSAGGQLAHDPVMDIKRLHSKIISAKEK